LEMVLAWHQRSDNIYSQQTSVAITFLVYIAAAVVYYEL